MDKVLVNLYVPRVEKKYDVYIPKFLTVKEVIFLLVKTIENLEENPFYTSGEELLCVKERRILMDNMHCIQDYGIKNGDELILI